MSSEILFNSFALVFVSEMGDKTQLLALILAARYKKPWTILLGIFIATILNHGLASYVGGWIASALDPVTLKWLLALSFFAFAAWILVPDKSEDLKSESHFGPLVTTIIAFFIAEMGDKTQLATVALGARYFDQFGVWLVTLGTTLEMMVSNSLAIFLGPPLLSKIPMKWIRIFASLVFLVFGLLVLSQSL